MTTPENTLKWSSQLTITPQDSTPILDGDKIILPPCVLEQLLLASTVTIPTSSASHDHSPLHPFNAFSRQPTATFEGFERQQNLPSPLTFRLVNPITGNIAYAGIREFSANDGEVSVSPFLRIALGIDKENAASTLTVHVQQLPRGTYVRLRPLEAGYDPEDWKALLERHMRNTFTTLTNGEILTIPYGKEEYKFIIDKVLPEGEGICIIDTDIEVDIEALSEEQARETLKRKLEKSSKAPETKDCSSVGGEFVIGGEIEGQVASGEYVDYTIKVWNHESGVNVELDTAHPTHVDLFLSPFSSRQRTRPREDEYVFGDISERSTKRIRIQPATAELVGAEALYISVRGYAGSESAEGHRSHISFPFTLRAAALAIEPFEDGISTEPQTTERNSDETQCKNCHQWVPRRTLMLHETFCYRNNVLCNKCNHVFQKSSMEWNQHWHCPHDDAYGSGTESEQKHYTFTHTPRLCTTCGYGANNTPDLARHRTTICPGKTILCRFCHLLVPQQGTEDPDSNDPAVILSGLTPHELSDGARTTDCHMCGRIVRLRDMATHTKHHDFERLTRLTPRPCRNINCGRTLDGVGTNADAKRLQPSRNDLRLCDTCYGPLYISTFDPDGKALKRRVERRYLTQLLTGCGKDWCRNEYCKTARLYLGSDEPGESITSKEAMVLVKPTLADLLRGSSPLHFCTDETSQRRRQIAEILAAEGLVENLINESGYSLPWCIAALEAESGDLVKARQWLSNWAPTRAGANR